MRKNSNNNERYKSVIMLLIQRTIQVIENDKEAREKKDRWRFIVSPLYLHRHNITIFSKNIFY